MTHKSPDFTFCPYKIYVQTLTISLILTQLILIRFFFNGRVLSAKAQVGNLFQGLHWEKVSNNWYLPRVSHWLWLALYIIFHNVAERLHYFNSFIGYFSPWILKSYIVCKVDILGYWSSRWYLAWARGGGWSCPSNPHQGALNPDIATPSLTWLQIWCLEVRAQL